jgi:hypothetical protein
VPIQGIGSVLVVLVIAILVFLLLREVMCWYYKINEIIGLLRETNGLLRASVQGAAAPSPASRAAVAKQVVRDAEPERDSEVDDPAALEAATDAAMREGR